MTKSPSSPIMVSEANAQTSDEFFGRCEIGRSQICNAEEDEHISQGSTDY